MAAEQPPARGHAVRPHTADARIEAWGQDPSACYEEAVAAFVGVFADVRDGPEEAPSPFAVGPGTAPELLVLLLEQVLFEIDVHGVVPRCARVEGYGGGCLSGSFTVVPVDAVTTVGAVPKGVSREDLSFAAGPGGWRCRATVDV